MSELAKRWAVAGVGIPVVLGLLYVGGWPLGVPVAVVAALGAREFYRMAAESGVTALHGIGAPGAAGLVLMATWRPTFVGFAPFALATIGGLTALALIWAIRARGPGDRPLAAVSATVFGMLYVGLPLAFVPLLHGLPRAGGWNGSGGAWAGAIVVALPLAATWLGDAVALFAGSAWGRGGLAPTISPNKSWVGVWAGLGGAALASTVWLYVARTALPGVPVSGPAVAATVGVTLGIGAVLGDLAESLLKREAGVKDSGGAFPGHGGVLDRLDALVFTLPAAFAWLVALDVGP